MVVIVVANLAYIRDIVAAAFSAIVMSSTGVGAEQTGTSSAPWLFESLPMSWDAAIFDSNDYGSRSTPSTPWTSSPGGYKSAWSGGDAGQSSSRKIASPSVSAFAVPGLTDKIPFGDYFFRFDAGRNNENPVSSAGQLAPSPEQLDNIRQVLTRYNRSQVTRPYVGFTLVAPH